jgi:hypothetical protein
MLLPAPAKEIAARTDFFPPEKETLQEKLEKGGGDSSLS